MADFSIHYDTVVIDEAQMLADRSRGGAWTAALFGLQADVLHVCASAEAKYILLKIADMCQDSVEIIEHKRFTPLLASPASSYDVLPGDARIVFSRKAVHGLASELKKRGHKVSMIYGAMPYTVRQNEAEKFRSGLTEVLVATDAIGMGLNLPIHRVVFEEKQKFDGSTTRPLNDDEIRQIAGRAGRYGIYPEGYISGLKNKRIKRLFQDSDCHGPVIQKAVVGFPPVLPARHFLPSEILTFWLSMRREEWIDRPDLSDQIARARFAEAITTPENAWKLFSMAFDNKDFDLYRHWKTMCKAVASDQLVAIPYEFEQAKNPNIHLDLKEMESTFRLMDLYYQYFKKFGTSIHLHDILNAKNQLAGRIMEFIESNDPETRHCSECGSPLAWDYPYGMCQKCYEECYGLDKFDEDDW